MVGNDAASSTAVRLGRGVITVVPVTPGTGRAYPFQVLLPAAATGLRNDSKAQAEQARSVALDRVGRQVGRLPPDLLAELDTALRLHLSLQTSPHATRLPAACTGATEWSEPGAGGPNHGPAAARGTSV